MTTAVPEVSVSVVTPAQSAASPDHLKSPWLVKRLFDAFADAVVEQSNEAGIPGNRSKSLISHFCKHKNQQETAESVQDPAASDGDLPADGGQLRASCGAQTLHAVAAAQKADSTLLRLRQGHLCRLHVSRAQLQPGVFRANDGLQRQKDNILRPHAGNSQTVLLGAVPQPGARDLCCRHERV
ncbi:hypothetical protein KL933_005267 [Ogataea haglerorum]|uniref:Uncharacterized protein n=1 Tax=Ogataea haglerorum TaxID=1937702 RepID=A0AAN6D0Q7_9ASCO|nr:hypothetical protein KL933_005267 [Ogataea haglerorum]KAG7743755.1 hypothetical protein KL932_001820 [Ogataea haglerorum]KAG7758224.1 hypothetical protein KL947_002603 [Ogataea haglerorum]KAG7808905.1 hypothetical protein KL924_002959 [Ogataea haglerorum]